MIRLTAAWGTGQHEEIDRFRRLSFDHRFLRKRGWPSILRTRLGSLPRRLRSAGVRSVGASRLSVGRMALASHQSKGGWLSAKTGCRGYRWYRKGGMPPVCRQPAMSALPPTPVIDQNDHSRPLLARSGNRRIRRRRPSSDHNRLSVRSGVGLTLTQAGHSTKNRDP